MSKTTTMAVSVEVRSLLVMYPRANRSFPVPPTMLRSEGPDLSHRVPGSNGARNGNVERGTPIFNTWWNDEYTASACSKFIWIVIQVN
jgi:hypothetical protein